MIMRKGRYGFWGGVNAARKQVKLVTQNSQIFIAALFLILGSSCAPKQEDMRSKSASEILGNPDYLAISYGGYRGASRDEQPTVAELKEDLQLMHAAGIRMLRTYNLQLDHAPNVLRAIAELKQEDSQFEMYVMLGAWIDCKDAWTDHPNHNEEDPVNNESEIQKAVKYATEFPDIVKVIAVGNEAMVHWAWSYWVHPEVILKYVKYLQKLKQDGKLPADLWITSSDNFASWGGGSPDYHNEGLQELVASVDYISMHTYPFHDTHYNPGFWEIHETAVADMNNRERIDSAVVRSVHYAKNQYAGVKNYMESLGVNKPIHIGETGWASVSHGLYGPNGSFAADEYKQGRYYQLMREWTDNAGISCFYFEAFNERWKDPNHEDGSENHFGLFTLDGQAKYAIWSLVDEGAFDGLGRGGKPVEKTFGGSLDSLMQSVLVPRTVNE